jgi:HRAS-like suppressor 3
MNPIDASPLPADGLAPGTHLSTPRRGYRHHGLYVGNGRVLHYAGLHQGFRRGPIEEVSLARFTRGRGFEIVASGPALFNGPRAIERARSRLGEDRYRLWSNNCEHFVHWCLHGTQRSAQVEAWRARLSGLTRLTRLSSLTRLLHRLQQPSAPTFIHRGPLLPGRPPQAFLPGAP